MKLVPSVDLRDFLSGDPERKQKFVNEIGKAYEEIGFVALKGHFLDDNLVNELYGEVKNFFELPTGGTAKMNSGKNLIYFARKEQCLALGAQLRGLKISNYKIFRIYPPRDISLLHPFDGVFPEKVNQGRLPVGKRDSSIGGNPNPSTLKFKTSSN